MASLIGFVTGLFSSTTAAAAASAGASSGIGSALLTAGSIIGAGSAIYQGLAARDAAEYNRGLAEIEADQEKALTGIEVERHRKDTQRLLARQRAGYAKSGVRFEGSPLLVMEETASEAALDELLLKYAGKSKYQARRAEASQYRAKGRESAYGGVMRAGSTLLTDIGQRRLG